MPACTNPSFSLLATTVNSIAKLANSTHAEPLRHHGRRLLSNFHSDADAQSSDSYEAVDLHHMPGLSSTTAMQHGDSVTVEQLLGKNDHPADGAAVDSTPEAAADDSNALSADDSRSSQEPAQVLGFKDNVKKAAQNVADSAAHLKDSAANKFRGLDSSHIDSDTAAVAEAHTTAVTSSDAVGGGSPPFLPSTPPMSPQIPPPLSLCHSPSSVDPLPHSLSAHNVHHVVQPARTVVSTLSLLFPQFSLPQSLCSTLSSAVSLVAH